MIKPTTYAQMLSLRKRILYNTCTTLMLHTIRPSESDLLNYFGLLIRVKRSGALGIEV